MVVKHVQQILAEKSRRHAAELQRLGKALGAEPLSENVLLLKQTPQLKGMMTILRNPTTDETDFVFYFDRLATLLCER